MHLSIWESKDTFEKKHIFGALFCDYATIMDLNVHSSRHLQGGTLLDINGVRTPINGRKRNMG